MLSRFVAFVIWAALGASGVFWAARLLATPTAVPGHATLVATATASKGDLARLFGKSSVAQASMVQSGAAAPADARFQLVGVVAPRSVAARDEGLAVIAFDGKPARTYRVGTTVDGDLLLLAVHSRGASLGPAGQPSQVNLELPLLPPPTTGSLPATGVVAPAQAFSVPPSGPGGQATAPPTPASMPVPAPGVPTGAPPPGERRNNPARGAAPL